MLSLNLRPDGLGPRTQGVVLWPPDNGSRRSSVTLVVVPDTQTKWWTGRHTGVRVDVCGIDVDVCQQRRYLPLSWSWRGTSTPLLIYTPWHLLRVPPTPLLLPLLPYSSSLPPSTQFWYSSHGTPGVNPQTQTNHVCFGTLTPSYSKLSERRCLINTLTGFRRRKGLVLNWCIWYH